MILFSLNKYTHMQFLFTKNPHISFNIFSIASQSHLTSLIPLLNPFCNLKKKNQIPCIIFLCFHSLTCTYLHLHYALNETSIFLELKLGINCACEFGRVCACYSIKANCQKLSLIKLFLKNIRFQFHFTELMNRSPFTMTFK